MCRRCELRSPYELLSMRATSWYRSMAEAVSRAVRDRVMQLDESWEALGQLRSLHAGALLLVVLILWSVHLQSCKGTFSRSGDCLVSAARRQEAWVQHQAYNQAGQSGNPVHPLALCM